LNVTDFDAQKKFFMDIFDAQPLKKDTLAGVKVGGMLIVFTKKTPDRGSEGDVMDHFGFKVKNTEETVNRAKAAGYETRPILKGSSLDHVGFEVKDLEADCKKLEAAGSKFDVPYRRVPRIGVAIAFLTDPPGVYIELTGGLYAY